MDTKITIGNVCFIQDREKEKILLIHRNKEPMKDLYTGVGGKTRTREDIRFSCQREVFEETGLSPTNVRLKGVLKTLIEGGSSSWILFAYTAESPECNVPYCNEGTLEWVPIHDLKSRHIIGFIRKVLPLLLDEESFFEGTVVHDLQGEVLSDTINTFPILLPQKNTFETQVATYLAR
jgi:ADP-ribose pyrophosphatase YjhB (NUDIX family)